MIPRTTIDTIKETASILAVVQDAGQEPKAGKICSPFTNEKTPSLHLYPNTNSYYDFSSDSGGDVIKLFMGLNNIDDFTTACTMLAERFNIPIPPTGSGNEQADAEYFQALQEKESLYIINHEAAEYFAKSLVEKTPAHNYLSKERRFNAETIAFWQLGYDNGKLKEHLTGHKFSLEIAGKAGLTNEKGNSVFYKRVIFPILNGMGKTIGFTARTIEAKPNKETMKYLNTATTVVFEKKAVLYGLFQNRKGIKERGEVLLVEGTTDVIALWQRGYRYAVATLDKNLTPERIKALKKITETVILWRDADRAGQEAAVKDIAKLLAAGFNVKVILSDGDKDPAEWANTARETEALPPAVDALIWYADELLPPTEGQPADRDKAIEKIAEMILNLQSMEARGLYVEEIAKRYKLKADWIYQKLKNSSSVAPDGAATLTTEGQKPGENGVPYTRRQPAYADIKSFKRVGVNYFKWVVVMNAKTMKPELTFEKWSPEIIKLDYCRKWKSFLDDIPSYDTFCVRPNFTNLQQSHIDVDTVSGMVSHNYNLVKPLTYTPEKWENNENLSLSKFPTIQMFLSHVFGNETSSWENPALGDPLTMIIDCLRIKFQKPTHLLPVVCLLSREQETGKSTFFDFMQDIFGSNAVTITKDHLESQFNTTYADRLIICAEEIKLTAKDIDLKNKLKHLATAPKIFYNPKGIAQREIEYYGWLMMSSNHEHDFLQLEQDDKRFWITKLKSIEKKDPNLRAKMVAEVPAFAGYLLNTAIFHPQETRIWFAPKYIENQNRTDIIKQTRTALDKAITYAVTNVFLTFLVTEERSKENNIEVTFKCDINSLTYLVNTYSRYKVDNTQIRDWIANNKGLKPGEVISFKVPEVYDTEGNIVYRNGKGRAITFVYFDWVTEEDLNTEEMKEIHARLLKELNEGTPF